MFYFQVLAKVLGKLHGKGQTSYRPVNKYVLNPKAVTLDELYGDFNEQTSEWRDGVLTSAMKSCSQVIISF